MADESVVLKDAEKAVKDAADLIGEGEVYVTGRKKKYTLLPCGLCDVSKLSLLMVKYELQSKKKPAEGETAFSDELMDIMAEVIFYAVKDAHPNVTILQIKKDFTLADFPVVFQKVLALNDFFTRAREMTIMKKTAEATITAR